MYRLTDYRVVVLLVAGAVLTVGCSQDPEAASSADRAGEYARRAVAEAGRAIDQQTRAVGDNLNRSIDETTGTVRRQSSDAAIGTKVKALLATDPLVGSLGIDVDTRDGVVTLSGRVKDEATRRRALEDARAVEGVVGVVDRLRVEGADGGVG